MKNYNIFFIRHGITEGNLKGEYIGLTDLPLCEQGRETINGYVKAGMYPSVDKVYTSPLKRCVQTARLIYPDYEPRRIDNLRECGIGEFECKTIKQLAGLPEYTEWIKGGMDARAPGGESHGEFTLRCLDGLNEVFTDMTRSGTGTAAVITHAGVIVNLLTGCGFPKGRPADFAPEQGEGWLIGVSAYLWQKGNVFEIIGKLTAQNPA
ncbi:MAG: histidine phosphatase family protein [Oscillospiraceae bacterium]|jgi:alpha-ribazole phosphatase|nr:histidine phosphatase family protein [Oscillospiraceae bacterium]